MHGWVKQLFWVRNVHTCSGPKTPVWVGEFPRVKITQKSRFAKNERIRKKRDEIVELSEWLAPDIHDMAGIFDSSPILISHYRRSLYAPHFTLPIDELKGLLWYF